MLHRTHDCNLCFCAQPTAMRRAKTTPPIRITPWGGVMVPECPDFACQTPKAFRRNAFWRSRHRNYPRRKPTIPWAEPPWRPAEECGGDGRPSNLYQNRFRYMVMSKGFKVAMLGAETRAWMKSFCSALSNETLSASHFTCRSLARGISEGKNGNVPQTVACNLGSSL